MEGVYNLRKRILLTLIVILSFGLIVACSSEDGNNNNDNDTATGIEVNKEGYPIVDEKLEMTMMAPGVGIEEWENMPLLQEYSEKTNIYFDYKTPPADDFSTNLNLAFSSGELADIIYGAGDTNLTAGMEVDYGSQGMLLPLEDLIDEYAPNLKKLFEERPDIEKSITTVDGHIYSLPHVSIDHRANWAAGPLWYNGDWLDALGVEELPKTTDEFYDLLVRFRDEDPNGNGEADEIPLSSAGMDPIRPWLLGAFGLKDQGIEEVDGVVRYGAITENYKEYLIFMNKLYEEKLLDEETFSQADEQKKAKGEQNRLGIFPDYFSFFTTGQSEEEATNNPMFHPLTSDLIDEPIIPASPGFSRGTFSITENNPSPEASIRWVDYFYSVEGGVYLDQGPEGYLWEYDEDGEKVELPVPDEYDSSEDYRATLTPAYGIAPPMLNPPLTEKSVSGELGPTDSHTQVETKEKMDPYSEVPFPLVYLTNEEQKEVNTIEVDLESYVEQMEARFITGVEPLDNWDEYVKTIEDMNIERYIEIHQDAYDRWADS